MKLNARVGDRESELFIERSDAGFAVTIDGETVEVDARKHAGAFYTILMRGRSYEVSVEIDGETFRVRHGATKQIVTLTDPSRRARQAGLMSGRGPAIVTAVMPGKVVRVLVQVGDSVEAGQGLLVVEAMKMENEIAAPKAGTITAVHVEPGRAVENGAPLVVVE